MYGLLVADHMNYKVFRSDNYFVMQLHGSWSQEDAVEFSERLRLLTELSGLDNWGVLTDFREWEGSTPQAYSEIQRLTDWMVENGEVAAVHVLNSGVKSESMRDLQERQRGRIAFDSFNSIEVALPWLIAKLKSLATH